MDTITVTDGANSSNNAHKVDCTGFLKIISYHTDLIKSSSGLSSVVQVTRFSISGVDETFSVNGYIGHELNTREVRYTSTETKRDCGIDGIVRILDQNLTPGKSAPAGLPTYHFSTHTNP